MRFKYSTISPTQNEFDRLPRIPLLLRRGDRSIEAIGLVDSGATVNVLPYELGIQHLVEYLVRKVRRSIIWQSWESASDAFSCNCRN